MIRSLFVSVVLLFGLGVSAANAQFTVGGVTGGAPTGGVNCYGGADGKIAAYAAGWTPEDCGVFETVCSVATFPCPSGDVLVSCTSVDDCTAQTTPAFGSGTCPAATVSTAYSCVAATATVQGSQQISYALTGGPAWLSINTSNGALSGTPGVFDHADYPNAQVVATAGNLSTSKTVPIVVNKPPYFSPVTCGGATAGDAYTCTVAAADDDAGDTLTYSIGGGAPAWLSISAAGEISGTPPAGSSAVSSLIITVTDSTSLTADSSAVTIAMNNKPVVPAPSCGNGTEGTAFTCNANTTDPDGDAITYSVVGAPSWLSINQSNGTLSGTPPTATTHTNITVVASDGSASSTSTAFSLVIDPDNDALASSAATAATNGTLTQADLTGLLTNFGATAGVDLSDTVSLDYVESCIAAITAPTPQQIVDCAEDATAVGVAKFEVGAIVDGTYASSSLTGSKLQATGAITDATDYSILNGNYCGSDGTSSCLAVLQGALGSASLSSTPTVAEIDGWINSVITADLQSQASSFTPVNPAGAPGCQASVSLTAPGACNHPSWTCSTSTADVSMTDTDSNGHPETAVLDASASTGGNKNYTIRRTLTFYGGSSYYYDHNYAINLTLASNSAYDFVSKTQSNSIPKNCSACADGYRMATKAEVVDAGYPSPDAGWYTDQAPSGGGGARDHCYFSSGSGSKCSSGTCGSEVRALGWCNNSSLCIDNKGWTSSQYSKSFYCVSINPTCS